MEWAPIIGAVSGAVAGGMISLVGTHLLGGKLVAYRLEINSRMDEYIKEIKTAALLTGANQARQEAKEAQGQALIPLAEPFRTIVRVLMVVILVIIVLYVIMALLGAAGVPVANFGIGFDHARLR